MARPASSYRAAWRNLARPNGGLSTRTPHTIKGDARTVADFHRRHAKSGEGK